MDDAAGGDDEQLVVALPAPSACRALLGGGKFQGAGSAGLTAKRNARIDLAIGAPFRAAFPAVGVLAGARVQGRAFQKARKAVMHAAHVHVVALARRAGAADVRSHLDFGQSFGQSGVLWQATFACCSHLGGLSDV